MEFATENYLNELLLNTEANGFESAKEAFYECINKTEPAFEVTAGQVVGGIIAAPFVLVAGVVGLALVIVAAVIGLVVKIIQLIVAIPVMIVAAIANKASEGKEAREGKKINSKIATQSNNFKNALQSLGIAVKKSLGSSQPIITKMDNIHIGDKDKSDFDASDVENLKMINESLAKEQSHYKDSKNAYEAVFNEASEGTSSIMYRDIDFSNGEWQAISDTCKSITPDIKKFRQTLDRYKDELQKTDDACKKAKAAGEKEVKLNSQATVATERSNAILKAVQNIVKIAGEWVKDVSMVANANKNANSEQKAATKLNSKDIEDNERDLELEKTGKAIGNNLKEWASKQPHLQGQKSK